MTPKNSLSIQDTLAKNGSKDRSPPDTIQSIHDFSKLWQLAFNASSDMISILDVNHRVVAVNNAMAKAMGRSPQKAIGLKCHDLIHHSDQPPPVCPHRALLEDGKAHTSEYYEDLLDMWMEIKVTPLYNTEKELIGSIHISRDITRQKRSEQAHRESEERYHHLSEATIEGVLLSEDSTIVAANQVLADMLGYSIKELTGMNLLKLVASHDRTRLVESLSNRMTGTDTFECIRKDGTHFPIEAHARAITYKGKMVYQIAIRDLTEQQRIEQDRILHARMRGVLEMAGTVCHEINQPLMALQGFIEILSSKADLEKSTIKNLHKMEEQTERIKALTYKMMHIAKYETKDYAGGRKIIDLDHATSTNSFSSTSTENTKNPDEYAKRK
jgi:PAS domain S-box-containing protein